MINLLVRQSTLAESDLTTLEGLDEFAVEKHRVKRNVFFDMIDDFTDDDDDDGSDEDDEPEEEEEESNSESVESTTTRFGRFMSPLAFSKISETLGFYCSFNLFCFQNSLQRNINSI